MILDKLENSKLYYGLGENFQIALNFLEKNDLMKMQDGKYPIKGDEVYMILQTYATKNISEASLEAHKSYIDLQYLACGEEMIGFCHVDGLSSVTEYDEEKDIVFFKEQGDVFCLKAGDFAIFFPHDAHMPSICIGEPEKVKKAVIKIKKEG